MKKKSNKIICFLLSLSNFSYFGSAECTFVRKNPNIFGFSLTYSYLCNHIINKVKRITK